jgi:cobyrinic acid a,c-diamide synthase
VRYARQRHPWPAAGQTGAQRLAHEFHYSSLENLDGELDYAYEVERGTGIDGRHDGLIYKNLLASYAHFRSLQGDNWANRFVAFVRSCKGDA